MEVRFVVTGFGPFANASVNPTTVLVEELVDYLKRTEEGKGRVGSVGDGGGDSGGDEPDQRRSRSLPPLSSVTRTCVIETSAVAAEREIDRLHDSLFAELEGKSVKVEGKSAEEGSGGVQAAAAAAAAAIVVMLHLGVNYVGKKFQIEKCAYNDADFRIPDERGHQPRRSKIVEHCELGEPLETLLDVPDLVRELNGTSTSSAKATVPARSSVSANNNPGSRNCCQRSVVSTDPGRFVCNYTYFYSLSKFRCSRCGTGKDGDGNGEHMTTSSPSTSFRSIFLHVPPFDVVAEEEQLSFIADLMECIRKQVLGGS